MKNFKGFALGLVLGIGLALSSVGFAQTSQTDQKKEAESCCAMASGCCKGESCDMKNKDHMKSHSSTNGGCCCCSGDSCDMRTHDMKDKPKG
jgi:hypothetical protein